MTMLLRASRIRLFRLAPAVALLIATSTIVAMAQDAPGRKKLVSTPPSSSANPSQKDVDRSAAYYHYGLAHLYEEMAVNAGRSDYAQQAVEEYKRALDADPNSTLLQDGFADLFISEAGRRGKWRAIG